MLEAYRRVRAFSDRLAAPLSPEDATLQSMPDASPAKWHLAHTTWFFETFLVGRYDAARSAYEPIDPAYAVLFNSYYNTVGEQYSRPHRGLISRPTLDDVRDYRRSVDEAVERLAACGALESDPEATAILAIGVNHEQQHQELLLTDIKHALWHNPMQPAYLPETGDESPPTQSADAPPLEWVAFPGGVKTIGHDESSGGFAYDNEGPRHDVLLRDYELANRPVTCGEYLEFIEDHGYERPTLWLAEGWSTVQAESWSAPLYWRRAADGRWSDFTLAGRRPIEPHAPVTHLSYFEADAYARWADARLPTEAEWEVACVADRLPEGEPPAEGFADELLATPGAPWRAGGLQETEAANNGQPRLRQMLGGVWEWTASPYTPYPGYAAAEGALGEYNGKFMVNQQVLRGGSRATSHDHIRPTYRNFFPTSARWQFSGVRLAR